MSLNNSRKFQGSKNEANKYLRSQGSKNKHQHIPWNLYQTLVPEDQLKASFSSDFLKGILGSNPSRPANDPVGDGEFTSLSLSTECTSACKSPPGLLAHHSRDTPCGCTGDAARKTPDYAVCSKKKSPAIQDDLWESDSQNRTDVHEGDRVNERNVHTFEREDIFCHREFVSKTAAKDNEEKAPFAGGTEIKQSRDSNVLNQISYLPKKVCERKSFQPNSEYRRVFKRELHPKLLSKTLGLSCLRPVCNVVNIASSGSSDTLKSRSSAMINHSSSVIAWNQPFELNIFTSNSEIMCDNAQNVSVQPEMKFSDCLDDLDTGETDLEGKVNYLVSRSAHHLCDHAVKFPLSTNQCHEEHLQVSVEKNSTTKKSAKIQQLQQQFTSEKHQDTEGKTQYVHHNQNGNKSFTNTRTLQKYEKPYRQWCRVSRVLAAESNFIVSVDSSNYAFSSPEKKSSLLEQKTEPITLNDQTSLGLEAGGLIWKEPSKIALISDASYDSFREGSMCDKPQAETSSEANVSHSVTSQCNKEKTEENMMEVEEIVSMSSTTLCAMPIDGEFLTSSSDDREELDALSLDGKDLCDIESSITLTDLICNNTKTCSTARTYTTETTQNKAVKDDYFRRAGVSIRLLSSSQPQGEPSLKRITLAKHPSKKKHVQKHITGSQSSCDHSRNCEYILDDTIHTFKHPNLVTGVSQITGPANQDNNPVFLDFSKMTASENKCNVLKTVNRNRYLDKIHRQVSSSINKNSACDSLTVPHSDLTANEMPKIKSYSRIPRHIYRGTSAAKRRLEQERRMQYKCYPASPVSSGNSKQALKCSETNCSRACEGSEEEQAQPLLPMSRSNRLFITHVTRKLLQKVNRAGLHVHWSEPTKTCANTETQQPPSECQECLPKQGSVRRQQRIIHQSSICGLSDEVNYDYFQAGSLKTTQKDPLHSKSYCQSSRH